MKELLPKLSFILLLLVVASMPTFRSFTPILITLFSLSSILDAFLNKTWHINNAKVFYIGLAFFAMHLISVFYSEHKDVAWFDIEVKLSLLVFPILFSIKNKYIEDNMKTILIAFTAFVVVANAYLLFNAVLGANVIDYFNITKDEIWRFSSSYLSKYIHPSYLSMYNLFAITFMSIAITNGQKKLRFLFIIPILFLILTTALLQSKAGFLAIAFVVLYATILIYKRLNNKLLKYIIPIIILLASVYTINKNKRMQIMYTSIKEIVKTGESRTASTGLRFSIWEDASKIIKQNIIFGVGAGDIKANLEIKYAENPELLKEASELHLNVHNQYLETWIGQGIIGLGLMLALFILAIQKAYKSKDHLLAIFIIIIIVNFFPESMLNQQAGVVFFALFYYLMMMNTNLISIKNN